VDVHVGAEDLARPVQHPRVPDQLGDQLADRVHLVDHPDLTVVGEDRALVFREPGVGGEPGQLVAARGHLGRAQQVVVDREPLRVVPGHGGAVDRAGAGEVPHAGVGPVDELRVAVDPRGISVDDRGGGERHALFSSTIRG
jgi:hypothetical protein